MKRCPACGEENPDRARFCMACSAPLEAPRAAHEERKVVTVLFADLVGFTSRSERMDVEDVRGTLVPYHQLLRRELERFGGTVEKFIGDAVMALFGAPVVHEDDAERAVRAALAIQEAVARRREEDPALDLHVRIGVTTGEALVAVDANPALGETMASGDVVNTAARLQAAAPVDGVLVGEATYRATSRAIAYEPVAPVEAKGKSGAVSAWIARRARARLGTDVEQRAAVPLVGREQEVQALWDTLARARAQRTPQLVTLVGVPGIGKSRLVFELFRRVDADPELFTWRQGRCLPYGDGVAFWALGEIVKAEAGILDDDGGEAAAAKLRTAVAEAVAAPEDRAWVEEHLAPLVGLVDAAAPAGDRRAEAFAAWRRFLEGLGERHPLVCVFEDLHWADDALLDFVDYLVEWASGVPLLVLCTARPELLERRRGWGGGKAESLIVSLAPLDRTATARLLASLLDQAVLPADAQAALLARTEGTPLYAEEYVRMLAERGLLRRDGGVWRLDGEDLPLPESVQGVIAARIDALPTEEKALLQDAAVIGKVFWLGAVAATSGSSRRLLEERLHRLERRQLVRRQRGSSAATELEYTFAHVLVRDVAYGQIPRAQRAEKHRLAADWIAALGGDRDDAAEMLAHHLVAALEYARGAGLDTAALRERAALALANAGDRAAALNAIAAARHAYQAALELIDDEHPQAPHILLRVVRLGAIEGRDMREALRRARERLAAAGDLEGAAEVEFQLGWTYWSEGRRGEVDRHLGAALRLLHELPDSANKARMLSFIAIIHMLAEEFVESRRLSEEALAIAEELNLDEIRAHVLNTTGLSRLALGEPDGLGDIERALELARGANLPFAVLRGQKNLASVLVELGELARARPIHEEGLTLALRLGDRFDATWFEVELAVYAYLEARWDEALATLDPFLAAIDAGDAHYMESAARCVRAAIRAGRGDLRGAAEDAERALAFGRSSGEAQSVLPAYAAVLLVAAVGHDEAAFEPALEGLRKATAASRAVGHWAVAAAEAAALAGAESRFPALGSRVSTPWVEAASALVRGDAARAADLCAAAGSTIDEALARLVAGDADRAAAVFRRAGASLYLARAEAVQAAGSRARAG